MVAKKFNNSDKLDMCEPAPPLEGVKNKLEMAAAGEEMRRAHLREWSKRSEDMVLTDIDAH